MFLVALAAKRDEPEPLRECEIEQRTGHSRKRWRLVVFPPEPAQHPVQMRDADRPTEPRTRRVLGNRAAKVCETHASRQREPRQRFVLIFQEERLVAVVVRAVVVIKRGNGQQQARLKSMYPGKSRKRISLPL